MVEILDIQKIKLLQEEAKIETETLISSMKENVDESYIKENQIDWQKYEEDTFQNHYKIKLSISQIAKKFEHEENS